MNNLEEESVSDFIKYTHKEVADTKQYRDSNSHLSAQLKQLENQRVSQQKNFDEVSGAVLINSLFCT